MIEVARLDYQLGLQVLVGNGLATLCFDPYENSEKQYTITAAAFDILIDRLTALSAKAKEQGRAHDVMVFDLFENFIEEDEEPCGVTN